MVDMTCVTSQMLHFFPPTCLWSKLLESFYQWAYSFLVLMVKGKGLNQFSKHFLQKILEAKQMPQYFCFFHASEVTWEIVILSTI